jgi:soluble cytochrome b562
MSVANESAASFPSAAEYTNWKSAFDQLTRALQRGELAAARNAFADLDRQLVKGKARTARDGNGAFLRSLDQIDDALRCGAIGDARQALAALTRPKAAPRLHVSNLATKSETIEPADVPA